MKPRSEKSDVSLIEKVELHQHVDGSIPLDVTWKLMKKHGLQPVATKKEMEKLAGKELGIRVAVRTGDTTPYEKQKMLKK